MNISIGFSKPKKFMIGAWLISVWMKKPYSHTFISFDSSNIQSTVYQASHNMVHFIARNNFELTNEIVKEYKIEVTNLQKNEILRNCINLAGNKYGYLELIKILFVDIFYNIGLKVISPNSKGYICSELVGEICKHHFNIKFDKPTNLLTPSDIDNKLKELYG